MPPPPFSFYRLLFFHFSRSLSLCLTVRKLPLFIQVCYAFLDETSVQVLGPRNVKLRTIDGRLINRHLDEVRKSCINDVVRFPISYSYDSTSVDSAEKDESRMRDSPIASSVAASSIYTSASGRSHVATPQTSPQSAPSARRDSVESPPRASPTTLQAIPVATSPHGVDAQHPPEYRGASATAGWYHLRPRKL
jgi:hypothetical protein